MNHLILPTGDDVAPFASGVLSALTTDNGELDPVQTKVLGAISQRFYGRPFDADLIETMAPEAVAAALPNLEMRRSMASLVVVMEYLLPSIPADLERHTARYLSTMDVEPKFMSILRDTAEHHLALLHADFVRHSYYTEETVNGVFSGRLIELARSKLSYYGVGSAPKIERKWKALGDCDQGTWGRGVYEFYGHNGFPFPGEPHGIYEIGARHDFVHVLADYDTTPEGEIDVFAFIAGTMEDPRGIVALLFTLALFQNAAISTVGGLEVAISRADTLDDDGGPARFADALWRASQCSQDVMGGIDQFDYADQQLTELRERWNIGPKSPPDSPRQERGKRGQPHRA